MQNNDFDGDNEIATEVPTAAITESTLSGPSSQEISNEKKPLAAKLSERIKKRVKSYIYNLDPRGKDKFWWSGNLVSTGASATLLVASPAALPFKSLASVTASVGLYAVEKGTEKYQKKRLSEEEFAEKIAKRQEKFPNGTSRMRRFFLGVSAGSMYGAALGIPLEATGAINYHPVKNIERRIDSLKQKM